VSAIAPLARPAQRLAAVSALAGPPTLALFATEHAASTATRGKLPLDATVVTVAAWPLAQAVAPAVDCVVLVRSPGGADDLTSLVRDLAFVAATPIVIAAEVGATELAAILSAGASAVVGAGTSGRVLWGAVQCSVSTALLHRASGRFAEAPLPAALRDALVALCLSDPPRASIAELCEAVGVHRRTLWYQWRRRVRAASPRLEDAVTAVLLLRAFMARAAGAGWASIALRDGVHRHTLVRSARRLLALAALPPGDGRESDAGHAAARRAFIENVVRPVLRRQIP